MQRRQELSRDQLAGFVMPKTVIGLAVWLLLIGVGAGLSGVIFFALYQSRIGSLQQRIAELETSVEKRFNARLAQLEAGQEAAKGAPGQGAESDAATITALLDKVAPSIAFVRGTDAGNAPVSGSGFVMQSDANQTWVLTNYRLVAGAAAQKRQVTVRLGIAERRADVFSTDPTNDLALLILKVGGQPVLSWLERGALSPGAGTEVWAVGTAPGRLGAAALKVRLIDSSPQSLLIDTDPGLQASGGPLLDKEGRVLGVLSSTYAPVGFPAFGRWVVPVRVSCLKVVRCPN